jgi:FAD/FMN-containing dehydrogenase
MDIKQFIAGVDGEVVRHDDGQYAEVARKSLHAPVPDLVVQPRSAKAVQLAVQFAVEHGLEIGVRCGGHGTVPSSNAPGLLIDLSNLDSVEVVGDNVVRVGGGADWGRVADELEPYELAISSGDHRPVGVGGLTLGGGVGWMVRTWGLTIDSLLSAEVVTASGDVVHASATENPELFWALRGGGGNFGVVTSFWFQAMPLKGVVAGTLSFAQDAHLATVLKRWRDVMRSAPEELNATFMAMPPMEPGQPPSFQLVVVYAGTDADAAASAIAPLLDLPGVQESDIKPMAYKAMLMEGQHPPEGMVFLVNNAFVPEFSDASIDVLVEQWRELAPAMCMIRSVAGAFNRVDPGASAFSCRDGEVLVMLAAVRFEESLDDQQDVASRWEEFRPFVTGSYSNFLYEVSEESTTRCYDGPTFDRLRAVKTSYDPNNVFHLNRNIRPL